MSLTNDIDVLSRVSLFEGFSLDQLRLVAFGAQEVELGAGAQLFRFGEAANGGFVVYTGRVALVNARSEPLNKSFGAGSLIGEMAILTRIMRPNGAIAETDCRLLYISREMFRRVLEEYPALAGRLHARISHNVRSLVAELSAVQEQLSRPVD
ncbi:MAG: cyclic nucleotide-binding domain-containing protein [Pseudomonadota bacterium]